MSNRNRAQALAAAQEQQPTQETTGEMVQQADAAAEHQDGEVAQAAEAVEAPQAPVVIETTTLGQAATSGNMASRGTIAPPRVKLAQPAVARVAPTLPDTTAKDVDTGHNLDLVSEVMRIIEGVPATHHFQILSIVEYCKKADLKNSNDVKTLANMNVGLWRNISNLINKQETHFEPLFTALLRIFLLESKNSMSEIAINRGIEHMALSKQELAGYMNITTLLRLTADPKSRKQVLKSAVNLPLALRNGLTQDGAARVVAYYETH